jgi:uncharacterized protein YegP (UPF0339 family)
MSKLDNRDDLHSNDAESPELTEAEVAAMRPASQVLSETLYEALIAPRSNRFRYEIYEDNALRFRWHLTGPDGRFLAESAESFSTKDEAKAAIQIMEKAVAAGPRVEAA